MTVAVVTGAGSGIGEAAALRLARRGCDVVLVGRRADRLEQTAERARLLGTKALVCPCDVASEAEVKAMAASVVKDLGPPRLVVHSAGVVARVPVGSMTKSDWDTVIGVNLTGVFLVTRAFLPAMLAARAGRFVAVASISSTRGTPALSAYCASKWGVVGFVKALAEELRGTGLQSLAVLPGSVDTPMLAGSGFKPQMSADDVAGLIVYAGLDAADAMNGSCIELFGP